MITKKQLKELGYTCVTTPESRDQGWVRGIDGFLVSPTGIAHDIAPGRPSRIEGRNPLLRPNPDFDLLKSGTVAR